MAGYFSYFPKIYYSLDQNNVSNPQLVTNILARSTFLKELLENSAIYYEYYMKEEDTPEIIADKLYGNPTRHWIVLLFNKLMNPYYELPLNNDKLVSYITKKYNQTLSQSMTTIHHYEITITRTVSAPSTIPVTTTEKIIVSDKEVDFATGQISTRSSLPGTADTSVDLGTTAVQVNGSTISTNEVITAVSNYAYEVDVNETKRVIKLLDKQYVQQVEDEFKKLMSNG